ncbi:MAG: class IV adenylate cyclase [Ignavibacteria bacterium]|nr:class IV adenylate cyclase [Ignavibacteria bacterium]
MPKNLEIKCKVDNLEKFKMILKEIKAKHIFTSEMKDVYFKVDKGRLKVRDSAGEKSIIFYNRNEDGKERWSKFFVIEVNQPQRYVNFFNKFLEKLVTVKKKRSLYHFGNTRIHLDKVERLGYFIELETKLSKSITKARKEFNFLCNKLNLDKSVQILNSYSDLILNLKK